ncbi:hypothetical protein [Ferrimonas sp.]|uniref:hypothetical protein n=1 Tax=Ferrimonas sp. TaxID=2080861 RepID=UPI003A8DB424
MFSRQRQWQCRSIKTLALVLVVLLSQLFGDNNVFTLHHPEGEHPFGVQVLHAHDQHSHHQHECDCCQPSDHEHADHVHCSCHPPQGEYMAIDVAQSGTVPFTLIHYRSLGYAPPIPPPNA